MATKQYWPDDYLKKMCSAVEAVRLIRRAQRVFIGTSCAEPQALVRELANQANRFADVEVVRLMSLETTPLTLIANQTACHFFNMRSFYLGSAKLKYLAENKRFITPINLSAVPRLFKTRQLPIHVAMIQVSPPDDFGWMSLGVAVDVTLAAARSADLVIAQVNPKMPRVLGRSFIHVDDVDVIVEHEEDLLTINEPPETEEAHQIARHVAKLVDDGSTLQMSLGATPQAIMLALKDKNNLGVHTQFLSDGLMRLIAQGVVTNRYKGINEGKTVASGAIGSHDLYEFLHDNPGIEFHPSDYVNEQAVISQHNKMISLHVIMAMDLTGQAACDAMPYNLFFGATGVMDFVRGAAASPGGKSILMLTSRTTEGKSSRITAQLDSLSVVIPRGDVQYVVTEYGVVNLFGKSLQERSLALISIAHPDFREQLFHQAKKAGLIGLERNISDAIQGVYPLYLEEIRDYDGVPVLFRPAKPVDERLIQEHFYGLDRADVITRFFHEKTSFLREELARVYQMDYIKDLTIVAVVGDTGYEKVIAVGGYFLDQAKNLAEVAYSVSKAWQGKGLASVIQRKLTQAARDAGIAGLVAYTTPYNQNMIWLFKRLPYNIHTTFDGDMLVLVACFDDPVDDGQRPPAINYI
jgi:acyl-CoA hydrolase/RimJ/RimL family protein N-acetyltransferase